MPLGTAEREGQGGGFGFNIRPGILFFPAEKLGLEASLGYLLGVNTMNLEYENPDSKESSVDVDLFNISSATLNIGAFYYFR